MSYVDDHDYEDPGCQHCDGSGEIVVCVDDMCRGLGECALRPHNMCDGIALCDCQADGGEGWITPGPR